MKDGHNTIKSHLESLEGVERVIDLLETPNRYGANVSYFTIKYNSVINGSCEIGRRVNLNIDWSRGILFIANKGYFPFKDDNDILTALNNNL